MALKDILVLIDHVHTDSPAVNTAIALAEKTGAHLTGLGLIIDPVVPGFIVAPVPVDAFEEARSQARKSTEEAVVRFEAKATRAGISRESRMSEIMMGGAPDAFTAQCRLTDLAVIGQADPDQPEPMRDQLIETALFDGCAPILLVPYIGADGFKTDNVMIAWDGSRTAARAVHSALPILPLASKITVVVVGALGLAGEPGADVALYLARHGFSVEVQTMPGAPSGVADTLLNHVSDHGFDLVVMGGYGHSRLREFILGGATRDILKSMTVPVLMAH